MTLITDTAADTYRDYVTAGVPASGPNEPLKSAIRALFGVIDTALSSLGVNGAITVKKASKTLLDADLAHAADTLAIVYNDGTAANNGIYAKSGGSGSGSWTITGLALPSTFADDIAGVLAQVELVSAAVTAIPETLEALEVAADEASAAAASAAADRAQTALDRTAVAAARTDIIAIAGTAGTAKAFETKAAADAGIASVSNGQLIVVLEDETNDDRRTLYIKSGGAYGDAYDFNSIARTSLITFEPPYADGKVIEFPPIAAGLGSYRINYSETEFNPDGMPDPVMQWGYNINEGGGLDVTGEPAIALQIEGNYDVGDYIYVEQHLLYVDRDGVQHRPWSWRIDTAADGSGAWDYLLQFTTLSARLKTEDGLTDNPFWGVGGTSFFWLPGLDAITGEPASGINMSGDNTQFTIGKIGGSMGLNFSGWSTVEFPGNISFTGSNGNIQTPGAITSDFLTFADSKGQLGNHATDITLDCYSGADFVLRMVAGAGEAVRVDHATGRVTVTLPTYADNAAAAAGGLTANQLYKTATGEVRVVV